MIATRTEVKCTEHNGAHTGIVVAHLGNALAIKWHGSAFIPKTDAERELAKAHAKHFVSAPESAVTPA